MGFGHQSVSLNEEVGQADRKGTKKGRRNDGLGFYLSDDLQISSISTNS